MDNREPTFIPERVEFQPRPLMMPEKPGRPAEWTFAYQPAISGTLHYPDGRQEPIRVPLTNEEDKALREFLTAVGARAVAERKPQ
jgi:hypothetical protein